MISPFKKIRYVFLVIVLLPSIVFSIHEMGNYHENEKVIQTIFDNQLESILYSVNQYSEGMVSGWANKISLILQYPEPKKQKMLDQFSQDTHSVEYLAQFDSDLHPLYVSSKTGGNVLEGEIREVLANNRKVINRLSQYLNVDYRKTESLRLRNDKLRLLVFLDKMGGKTVINTLVVNPINYIQSVLDPKIEEISQNKFYIGAFIRSESNMVYSSDKKYTSKVFEYKKPVWFFDDFYWGIELRGQTIRDLAIERARKNIFLIGVIDLLLLIGAWIIYSNLKKQVELAQMKSDFVSNVSHEIRTPLALISMYTETIELDRARSEADRTRYFTIIAQEAKRLSAMVNKILDFSKTESGKHSYSFAETDLNALVEKVVGIFRLQLETGKFDLKLDCDPTLPNIWADADTLTNAIMNLVDNAIKYSGENKSLSLSTYLRNGMAVLEVADKGIGISPTEQNRIFDKFYRVTKKDLAQKAHGFGLGLTLVKYIADAHKGRIRINSKLGEGTSFQLELPLKPNTP